MFSSTYALLIAQQSPLSRLNLDPSTQLQLLWAAGFIIFVFSVLVCGLLTKRMNNISGASYGKAFLATFLKGLTSLAGFFVFGLYLQAPWYVALGIAYSLIPITVYKIVFACMWREAMLIWFVTWFAEGVVAAGLLVAALFAIPLPANGR